MKIIYDFENPGKAAYIKAIMAYNMSPKLRDAYLFLKYKHVYNNNYVNFINKLVRALMKYKGYSKGTFLKTYAGNLRLEQLKTEKRPKKIEDDKLPPWYKNVDEWKETAKTTWNN